AAPGAGVIVQYLVDVDYSDFTAEVEDNGDRVDLGAYGNTDTASLSGVSWVGGDGITWTGDGGTSSWADPLNWSNRRVPLSTDDVFIPDRDFDPILDAVAECRDLTISNYPNDSPAATGGTLTLEDDAFTLSIGGDLTVQGSPATTWNHTGGAVSVAGDVTLTGNFSNTGGTFTLNGTSVAGQAVAAANPTFHSLTIDNTGPGATVAMPSGGWAVALDCTIESADAVTFGTGTVTVGGDLTKNSAGTLTATSGTLSVAGDFSIGAGGFVHNAGTVTLNGTSNQALVTGGSAFSTLFLDNGAAAAVLTTTGNLIVASDLTLTASNEALFVIRDGAHSCTGSVTVSGGTMGFSPSTSGLFTAGGPFTVAAGAALTLSGPSVLRLPSTGLIVHGSLSALADTARPKITTSGTEGGSAAADHYALDFSPAGASDTINLYGIDISSPDADGLDINANGGQVARLDDINFTNGNYGTQSPDAYTNTYLTLRGVASGTYTFRLSRFDRHCRYNVKLRGFGGLPGTSTAVITMENAGGEKGDADGGDTPAGGGETWTGEGRDGDPDGDAHITWDYFKKWIGSVNTMWSLGANWQGGTAPRTSAPFEDVLIEPGQPWDPVLDVDASVNSFTIGAGGAMSLNTTTRTFTIQGDNFRTFGGSMDPGNGTIVFSGTAMQEVNVGINPIYNVVVRKSGGTVRLAANLVVRNDFDLEDGTVDLAGYALTIGDPAYGSSMGFTLDSDNDADGTLLMGTTSALTTRRSAVTNRATISMTGTSLWNAADSAGSPDDNTITLGPASGSGGSLSMTDSARIVVGDGDGTDALLTQGAAIFTMTAVSGAAPRLEAATGSASLTFNAPFRTVRYASSKPTITRRLVDSGYFGVLLTDIVDIQGLSISFANTGGVNVAASATLTNLNFIEFASVQPGSDSGHLKIARAAPGALVSEGCSFDDSYGATGGNIYLANSGGPTFTLTMSNAAGVGAGDAEEDTIPGTVSEGAGAEIEWVSRKAWAGRYRYKLRLRVTNGAGSPLPGGAPVEYTFDDSGAGIGGKHENTGNDVRVVYDDGTVVRELDRVLIRRYSDSGWGTASTQRTLAFPTQSSIGAGAFDNNYYLYYGYPNAGAPPADPEAVGVVFFDGLEGNSFTAGEWIVSSPASCIVTSATKNSGTYSARGETATSTLTFTRALSPGLASNLRLYFARSTSDLGTNDDVGFAAKYSVDGSLVPRRRVTGSHRRHVRQL
ncbi:MAG: hypothetical protein HYY93_01535, partial [Planctomycetes bacterium]|nr:hypothetical protein [Planctomycetota bacterium]